MIPNTHGLVGVLLFGCLLLHCLHQTHLLHMVPSEKLTLFLHIKKYFHWCFALNCVLEIIFSISLLVYDGEYVRWGYSCHLVGLYCNIAAFLLVIRLWNHVLAGQRLLPVRNRYYVLFLAVNLISTMTDLVVYCIYGEGDMTKVATVIAVTANVVYVLSLFVASCVLLFYGLDLKSKLSESSTGITESLRSLLWRINLSLLLFALCYGIRILGVAYITLVKVELDHTGLLLWVLVSFWIPTLGTGVIFLYIMHHHASYRSPARRRGTDTDTDTNTDPDIDVHLALSSATSTSSPTASLAARIMILSVDRGGDSDRDREGNSNGQEYAADDNPLRQNNRMYFYSSDSVVS